MSKLRTLDLAVDFAKTCRKIKVPKYLRDQLDRASSSVALNLAEGSAKDTVKERHRLYRIALGSFREVETILLISEIDLPALMAQKSKLAGSLINLCKATK